MWLKTYAVNSMSKSPEVVAAVLVADAPGTSQREVQLCIPRIGDERCVCECAARSAQCALLR